MTHPTVFVLPNAHHVDGQCDDKKLKQTRLILTAKTNINPNLNHIMDFELYHKPQQRSEPTGGCSDDTASCPQCRAAASSPYQNTHLFWEVK